MSEELALRAGWECSAAEPGVDESLRSATPQAEGAKRSDNRNTGCQQLTAQAANTGGVVASRGNGETEAAGELLPEVCWRLAGAETQHDVQENPTRLWPGRSV